MGRRGHDEVDRLPDVGHVASVAQMERVGRPVRGGPVAPRFDLGLTLQAERGLGSGHDLVDVYRHADPFTLRCHASRRWSNQRNAPSTAEQGGRSAERPRTDRQEST